MKVIEKVVEKMVKIDEDKSSLKLQILKISFEFKLPFVMKTSVISEFKIKEKK